MYLEILSGSGSIIILWQTNTLQHFKPSIKIYLTAKPHPSKTGQSTLPCQPVSKTNVPPYTNRPPLLVPACPSPSRRYPLRPLRPLWPRQLPAPSLDPTTAGQCPAGGARATHPNRYYTTPSSYARTYVCAREDQTHPVRHWLVRAGPIQHPGNYPGPAAVEHPLATHPPPLCPTHATMPARW